MKKKVEQGIPEENKGESDHGSPNRSENKRIYDIEVANSTDLTSMKSITDAILENSASVINLAEICKGINMATDPIVDQCCQSAIAPLTGLQLDMARISENALTAMGQLPEQECVSAVVSAMDLIEETSAAIKYFDHMARLQPDVDMFSKVTDTAIEMADQLDRFNIAPLNLEQEYIDVLSAPIILDPEPGPAPSDGIPCGEFTVSGGRVDQIASVFDEDVGIGQSPKLYLSRHGETYHWHIHHFPGDEDEAWLLWERANHHDDNFEYKALERLLNETIKIGYLYASDRPVVPVRVFTYDEKNGGAIETLTKSLKGQLLRSKFVVEPDPAEQNPTLEELVGEDGQQYEIGKTIIVRMTLNALADWIRSHLRSVGLIPESMSVNIVRRHDGQVSIYYPSHRCLILLHTTAIRASVHQISMEIVAWSMQIRVLEQELDVCKQQLSDLISALKEENRWEPIKPKGRDLVGWFDYYHECKSAGRSITLNEIASETNYDPGYIRQKHTDYKLTRDI